MISSLDGYVHNEALLLKTKEMLRLADSTPYIYGYMYAVYCKDGGGNLWVRIGRTVDPRTRMYQTGYPEMLRTIRAVEICDYDLLLFASRDVSINAETYMHRRLRKYRARNIDGVIGNEWFTNLAMEQPPSQFNDLVKFHIYALTYIGIMPAPLRGGLKWVGIEKLPEKWPELIKI